MTKDAVATMGAPLPDDAGGRDAVHVAVFSAFSDERLFPGQHIAIIEHGDRDTKVSECAPDHAVAIVDPFMDAAVFPGTRFWAYLYPRTITALSHRWSHPAFESSELVYSTPSGKLVAEERLRALIKDADCPGYEWFIAEAVRIADGGMSSDYGDEYLHVQDRDAHGEIPDEMWSLAEIVIGKPIKNRPTYFSCSC